MDAAAVRQIREYLAYDTFTQAAKALGSDATPGAVADLSDQMQEGWIRGLDELFRKHGDDSAGWNEERFDQELRKRGFCGFMQVGNRTRSERSSYYWNTHGVLVVVHHQVAENRLREVDLLFNWLAPDDLREAWLSACVLESSGMTQGKAAWGDEALSARFRSLLDVRVMAEGRWAHTDQHLLFAGAIPCRSGFDYHLSRLLHNPEGSLLSPWESFPLSKEDILAVLVPGLCSDFLEQHPWMHDLVLKAKRQIQLLTPPAP